MSVLVTAHAVEARLEAALAPLGLSLPKLGVLHHLAVTGAPVPLRALAEHQGCVPSNITQLVDRLEREGLVERRDDPADRRSVRAVLTAAGERAYARGMQALADAQGAIVRAIGPAEAAHLQSILAHLAA